MAPNDPFQTEEEFRYAAECRRLARLAQPSTRAAKRIDIAWYLRTIAALGEHMTRAAGRPSPRSNFARYARHHH